MMAIDTDSKWFPLFEFQDWSYRSFLISPAPEGASATAAAPAARQWAKGALVCGQAFSSPDGYTLSGNLVMGPGIELAVSAKGDLGSEDAPGTFEATGTGTEGVTKGAVYQLVGWVFAEQPEANGAGKVLSVRGSVRAVRGPMQDRKPNSAGCPLDTVGLFEIVRAS